jgi:hypothetical protein
LQRGFNVDNSFYPTVAVSVDPATLFRNTLSTPSRFEKTTRRAVVKFVNDLNHAF